MTEHLNIGKCHHEEIQLLVFEYLGRIRPMQDLMKILAPYSFISLCLFVCLTIYYAEIFRISRQIHIF